MQPNPEIESIIQLASDLATERRHEYVTLEHLLLAMAKHDSFKTILHDFGADYEAMIEDIEAYLSKQTHIVSNGYDIVPKKTHSLERVFNRAFTQVLF